jgi:hypothetical protein
MELRRSYYQAGAGSPPVVIPIGCLVIVGVVYSVRDSTARRVARAAAIALTAKMIKRIPGESFLSTLLLPHLNVVSRSKDTTPVAKPRSCRRD